MMKKNVRTMWLVVLALVGTSKMGLADDQYANLLPEVVVTGSRDRLKKSYITTGIRLSTYTEPLLDTPQSISVISKELMDNQHVTTMRDAVRNVAGISLAAGEGGAQGDSLTLRGFTARNDIFLDGMRDFGSYYRDSFNWEKVEVLKGPSSVAFGRGSTGGVVNQVSKTPELKSEKSLELTVGGASKERISTDINQPLPQLGSGTSFRLNAFAENSNVVGRNIVENNHAGIAPAIVFGLGTSTRVQLSYLHEQSDDIPDYGIPWLFDKPAAVDRRNFYGFKSDFLKTSADVWTFSGEHDLSDTLTIRDQIRYGSYARKMRATEARLVGNPTPSTPLDNMTVNRNEINTDSTETFFQNQLNITSKFDTGSIEHTLVVGMEVGAETSSPKRYTIVGVPPTNLQSPNTEHSFSGTYTLPTLTQVSAKTIALYGVDTLKLDDQWALTLGARWDQFDLTYTQDAATPLAFSSLDNMTSWRGALVYKPTEEGSFYFGYGTSFNPSAEALSLSASTAGLSPEQNTTYELGVKWDLLKRLLSIRSSIFRTEKINARETDPNNAAVTVLSGIQRVDGFELEAMGHLTEKWQMSLSYAYMKSRLESSKYFPIAVGSPLANVPENTVNIWSTYQLPWKLTVGGGMNLVDSRRASSTVPNDPVTGLPKEIPAYCVWNVMMAYPVTDQLDIQLNITNLLDTTYYDQVYPAHIVPGEGRSFVLSSKIKL